MILLKDLIKIINSGDSCDEVIILSPDYEHLFEGTIIDLKYNLDYDNVPVKFYNYFNDTYRIIVNSDNLNIKKIRGL